MRKTNEGLSPVGVLLPAGAAGLGATLLLMLVGAILVHRQVLPEQAIAPCALLFLALLGPDAFILPSLIVTVAALLAMRRFAPMGGEAT